MRARLPILICLLVPALAAAGPIYRSTDAEGNTLFTDQPPADGAQPITVEPLTTVPVGAAPAAVEKTGQAPDPGDPAYNCIHVTYPPAEQAIRRNGGIVPFRVALEPEGATLQQGHAVQILVDGKVRGSGSSLQISVSPISRGAHTVSARVVDATGRPLAVSDPVRFHLLRASVGN